jgi:hypothetical protein
MRDHRVRLPHDLLPWQHVLLGSSSSSRPSSAAFTTQALPTAYGSPVPPPLSRTVGPLPAPKASIGSHTHLLFILLAPPSLPMGCLPLYGLAPALKTKKRARFRKSCEMN